MSHSRKLSHAIWHCQYHIVWVPKYRYRILTGLVGQEVERCIRAFSERLGAEIVELNVQEDHIHLLAGWPRQLVVWVPKAQEDPGLPGDPTSERAPCLRTPNPILLSLRDTDNKLSVLPATRWGILTPGWWARFARTLFAPQHKEKFDREQKTT